MDLTKVEAILDERKLNSPNFRLDSILHLLRIRLEAPMLKHGDRRSVPCVSYYYALRIKYT
jgi:hypothetical protein